MGLLSRRRPQTTARRTALSVSKSASIRVLPVDSAMVRCRWLSQLSYSRQVSAARLAVEEVLRGHIRGEIDGNRVTLADVQLRLSRTGHWWSFEKRSNVWQPVAGPAEDADELVEPVSGRRR